MTIYVFECTINVSKTGMEEPYMVQLLVNITINSPLIVVPKGNGVEWTPLLFFKDAVGDFLLHMAASGRSKLTLVSYGKCLARLESLLNIRFLEDIRERDIENAIITLSLSGPDGLSRSTTTVNHIKSVYRSFFKWCMATDRLVKNPAQNLLMAPSVQSHTVPFTPGEVESFLAAIRESGEKTAYRDEALFSIYAFTGIRRSEALALRIKDYSPRSRILLLPHVKGAGKSPRYVTEKLAQVLERYISIRKEATGHDSEAAFFSSGFKKCKLSPRQVQYRFEHWKCMARLRQELTIHSFRAGFATRLHEVTGSLVIVARALGHRDHRNTEKYISVDVLSFRKALEEAFG